MNLRVIKDLVKVTLNQPFKQLIFLVCIEKDGFLMAMLQEKFDHYCTNECNSQYQQSLRQAFEMIGNLHILNLKSSGSSLFLHDLLDNLFENRNI